ncbi:MAG: hypothetical protein V5A38_08070 [Halolamina sp.]|uniref:hypothetical protein n=1 Tax=Halolamina sp. TaxID=1940283 RepID=UPI002FC3DE19
MSKRDPDCDKTEQVDALPVFDLCWDVDDVNDPTYITVFAEQRTENVTQWISIETDYAVGLDDVR